MKKKKKLHTNGKKTYKIQKKQNQQSKYIYKKPKINKY